MDVLDAFLIWKLFLRKYLSAASPPSSLNLSLIDSRAPHLKKGQYWWWELWWWWGWWSCLWWRSCCWRWWRWWRSCWQPTGTEPVRPKWRRPRGSLGGRRAALAPKQWPSSALLSTLFVIVILIQQAAPDSEGPGQRKHPLQGGERTFGEKIKILATKYHFEARVLIYLAWWSIPRSILAWSKKKFFLS